VVVTIYEREAQMRWLTTKQVADEMGVQSNTVRRWCTHRGLKYSDIGVGRVKIRIAREDLDTWVKNPNKQAA
jgi:excisionase family DNA binding protein